MRPIFQPSLVNGPFDDPALYVDLLFERRALLFDLGDLGDLPPRKVLRTTHVFVTHTHMDHFVGFDRVLRTLLGRERPLALFGPVGFIEQVCHRLASFTWNLVGNYPVDLHLTVGEVAADGASLSRATMNSREGFARRDLGPVALECGLLLDEPSLQVRCAVLDHGIPCLAFALQEVMHVNVWPNRLEELGVRPGAWLRDAKRLVLAGAPDDTPVHARWREGSRLREGRVGLGTLRRHAMHCSPGQKIAYVTDVAYTPGNVRRIAELASASDVLFIESPFLQRDVAEASRKRHLTAHQAGVIARRARAREIVPFHFSPRYGDCPRSILDEARAAFSGDAGDG